MQKGTPLFLKNFSLFLLSGLLHVNLWGANNEAMYNSCRFCHGEKGELPYLGKVEPINRLDKTSLVILLQGYKQGTIDQMGLGKMMQAQIANFSESDIEALATYITQLASKSQ